MGRKLVRAKDLERRRIMAAFDQTLQQFDESCIGWTACCLGCEQATEICGEREAVLEWRQRHQAASGHEVMVHRESEAWTVWTVVGSPTRTRHGPSTRA